MKILKILYVTDLHGNQAKYWRAFEAARANGAQAVVNGGDMLSMEDDLHRSQREFIICVRLGSQVTSPGGVSQRPDS
jgi:predicted phosphodiesterase